MPPDATLAAAAIAGVDEVYRVGGAQAIGALAYGTESIRAGRRDRRARATSTSPRQARGGGRGPGRRAVVPSPGRARWSWSPTAGAGRLRRHRRRRAGRARARRPGLAGHLGRRSWPTRSPTRSPACRRRRPAGRDIEATLAARRLRGLVDGPEQAIAVANAIAPEHLELHGRRPRGARAAGPPRRRRVLRPVVAGLARRLPRRAVARAPHLRLGPLRPGAHRGATSPSTSTSSPPTRPRCAGARPPRGRPGRGRRPRRPRRQRPRRPGRAGDAVCPCATTSRRWRATTRPRSTSRSGSTPTSRPSRRRRPGATPSPPSCRRLDWHRYPDRAAAELRAAIAALHGVEPGAGLRGQRLERGAADAAARLRRARAGAWPPSSRPTSCTATSPGSPAPTVVEGERARRLHARPRRGAPGRWPRAEPVVTFLCSPNNPTGHGRAARTVVREVLDLAPGAASWSTRPTASSRPWSALDLVDDDRPLVVTRTFSKTWSMAAARLGYLVGPSLARGRARQGRAAVPPRRGQADRRPPRPALRRRDGGAGEGRRRRARADRRRPGASCRSRCGRRAPTSSCSGPTSATGQRGVARRCSTAPSSCATARRGRGSTAACGSPSARRAEDDAFLAALRRGARSVSRVGQPRSASTKETDVAVTIDLDGTGAHRGVDRPAVLRPHARPARPPRRLRPHRAGRPATSTSTATTRSRTRPSSWARRSARRSATRPACAASPAACTRSTRRWSRWRSTCPGRPFVVWEVELPEAIPLGTPPFDPSLAEHAIACFATAAGITLHVTLRGAATSTTSSRPRSRAWPAACATPCASRAPACRRTKGVL